MRTIKTYSNRAPFYNAFIRTQGSIKWPGDTVRNCASLIDVQYEEFALILENVGAPKDAPSGSRRRH